MKSPSSGRFRRAHGTLISALLVLLLGAPTAGAFSFSPMVTHIDSDRSPARVRYTLQNDTPRAIAVEISAHTRDIDASGVESMRPTDHLRIYPSQIVLASGRSQEITVEWTGGTVSREHAYRIVAEQIPVNLGDTTDSPAQLRVNLEYITSLYIRPGDAQPSVEIASVEADADAGAFRVRLINTGTMHALLRDLTFVLSGYSDGSNQNIAAEDLFTGSNVLLPGAERRIAIPWDQVGIRSGDAGRISVDIAP